MSRLLAALVGASLAIGWLAATQNDTGWLARHWFGRWPSGAFLVGVAFAGFALWSLLAALSARLARGLLVLATTGLVMLAVLELPVRLGWIDWTLLPDTDIQQEASLAERAHLDLSGSARPDIARLWGLDAERLPYHFRTDRHGFRNRFDREGADLLLLGDSFLEAGLVPIEQTLGARLEERLGLPTMVVARSGLGVQAERDLLAELAPELSGRLVLHVVFEGNDLLDSQRYRAHSRRIGGEWPWWQRSLTYGLLVRLRDASVPGGDRMAQRSGTVHGETVAFFWTRPAFEGLDDEVPAILDALAETRDAVRTGGGRYAVVIVPSKLRVLGPSCEWPAASILVDWERQCSPLPQALVAWGHAAEVPVIDLTAALREATAHGELPWFALDTHWNDVGHDVATRTLAEWEPLRAWAAERQAAR